MDEDYMNLALELAEKGRGTTSPNPMVGAVVVKNGRIIGRGYHAAAGGAHAEVNAINSTGEIAQDATLYITLEPCNHTGRTPPCTEKIITAKIRRVVVAMNDPNPHVTGGGIEYLKSHGIEVTCGVGEARAKRLNEAFIKFVHTGQPFVIVKCASTLDGWIATRTGDSKWVTGKTARAYVHQLRHAVDAIMVGIGTVRADDPSLNTRLEKKQGRDPARIVIDPMLSIDEDARLLHIPSNAETILVTGEDIDFAKASRIEKLGVNVMRMSMENGSVDFNRLMASLGAKNITSLLIEGGGGVIGSAFQAGIVDKALFFFAPKVLGGDDGVPICRGAGPAAMKDCLDLKSIQTRRFDDDVMIEGYVI
ncbi:MAG: bifunctional diaminohydroxyphosphoribosylaminopyrimidine deaminase/5-amino-6-(5-phosphoribosylamino)uracil reductase RibD [Thermodesulfobacteriota bacterium]|nr:bifunctional diaminohydroxyphosphoribosylaminopyrimidine deaminase/5-amino-6-(5-phosphoribosylamino)uracil reductase RibD [Thermodesulfobacteriota bacterium]